MTSLSTHRLLVDVSRGMPRAIGVRGGGVLRVLRILNATEPAVFFRRFGSMGAVAAIGSAPWPAQVELEMTVENRGASPSATIIEGGDDGSEAGSALPWQRLAAIERWLIEHAPTESLRLDAEFFYGIECAFNPRFVQERGLPEAAKRNREEVMDEVDGFLARLVARLGRRQTGDAFRDGEIHSADWHVGPVLDELFKGRFGNASGHERMAAAVRMFARFGAGELAMDIAAGPMGGELALRMTNGAPNGPLVFAFAEYALYRLNTSRGASDKRIWSDVLPGCILAAELYLMAYHLFDREGAVSKALFRGDAGGPRPLLRRLGRQCVNELMQRYLEFGCHGQRQLLESRLAGLLRSAFVPIEPLEPLVPRSRRDRVIQTSAHRSGVFTAVFPDLPVLEVRAPGLSGA